jgi:AcrR family transcriptional regulator
MRNKTDLKSLNLREIARNLNCAHTNLYNYFRSYEELLWETHAALLETFTDMLEERLKSVNGAELKIRSFFKTFTDIYLNNKGWFKLAWVEYIGDGRPDGNISVTERSFAKLTGFITAIWQELYGGCPDSERVRRVLHNAHCYIVGEVSNHIAGRRIIDNEDELKEYIAVQAAEIMTLCMKEG